MFSRYQSGYRYSSPSERRCAIHLPAEAGRLPRFSLTRMIHQDLQEDRLDTGRQFLRSQVVHGDGCQTPLTRKEEELIVVRKCLERVSQLANGYHQARSAIILMVIGRLNSLDRRAGAAGNQMENRVLQRKHIQGIPHRLLSNITKYTIHQCRNLGGRVFKK